jgi:hypothetical protein
MTKIKIGKTIIPLGVFPQKHELETAWFFNELGKDIEFLKPIDKQHIKTPDIKMDGIFWEIKSPIGSSSRTIENNLRTALCQSTYIIIDLRKIKLNEKKAIMQIQKVFNLVKKFRRILIICKGKKLIDLEK